MHSGETILAIGGLILLSIFALSLNSSIVQNQSILYQSEGILDAYAIAQKYLEQAEVFRFDENKSATIPSSFTYLNNLGPDTGEQYPYYNDIDDFNNFSITDSTSGHSHYLINISVYYITKSNPEIPTPTRTYFKRMEVTVSSEFLQELPSRSVSLQRVFCYHNFYTD
jgi:hypothetical protein